MDNFLNQFDNKHYKQSEEVIIDKKEGIKGPEHKIEIDDDYKKNKIIKVVAIVVAVLIVLAIILFAVQSTRKVEVTDFVGKNLSELKIWALKNDITIETNYVYDEEYSEEIVIKQSKKAHEIIYKKDTMLVEVSKGVDSDEIITIPDFNSMDYNGIQSWIETNKLTNTYVTQEYNTIIAKNKYIRKQYSDVLLDDYHFKRKDTLTIYVSKGIEEFEKNIEMPDFVSKLKSEVEAWAKTNEIKVTYIESASDKILEGAVISQNISPLTKIAKTEAVTIYISIGKIITVPDYSTISKDDAKEYVIDLDVKVRNIYSETIPYGKLISQSVSKGTKLNKNNNDIELVYSEGRPFIDDLTGKLEKELPNYFYSFNIKGTNITYTTVYVDSAETRGTVVYASKNNEYVALTDSVIIHISKGNL